MCYRFCDMVGIKLLIALSWTAVQNISQFHSLSTALSTAAPLTNNPQQNYYRRLPLGSVAISVLKFWKKL